MDMYEVLKQVTSKIQGKDHLLQPRDFKNFLLWGSVAFLGVGAIRLGQEINLRKIDPTVDLGVPVDSFHQEPRLLSAFVTLHEYAELSPYLFKNAAVNSDQLVFLERALVSGKICAVKRDKYLAWTNFKMATQRLDEFQKMVREKLGVDHELAVRLEIQKVKKELERKLMNVLHLCEKFHPENMVSRAKSDVRAIMN